MVTIIYSPEAPNPKVGPPRLPQLRTAPTYTTVSFDLSTISVLWNNSSSPPKYAAFMRELLLQQPRPNYHGMVTEGNMVCAKQKQRKQAYY